MKPEKLAQDIIDNAGEGKEVFPEVLAAALQFMGSKLLADAASAPSCSCGTTINGDKLVKCNRCGQKLTSEHVIARSTGQITGWMPPININVDGWDRSAPTYVLIGISSPNYYSFQMTHLPKLTLAICGVRIDANTRVYFLCRECLTPDENNQYFKGML